jgi:WD40 repeat protein
MKQRTNAYGNEYRVWAVAISSDGKTLASGAGKEWYSGAPGEVKLWDVGTGKEVATLRGHKGAVMAVAFSPDARLIASASEDRTVMLWDRARGVSVALLTGHWAPVVCVAFSPDGKTLASGSADGSVRLWTILPEDGK